MSGHTKPQIIKDNNGNPAFAVIPYAEYLKLTHAHEINLKTGVPNDVVNLVFDHNYSPMKAWRMYLNLTQAEIAHRLGITQAAYAQYEQAENPRVETLKKVAVALELTLEQLDF